MRRIIYIFLSLFLSYTTAIASDSDKKINILRFDKDLYTYLASSSPSQEKILQTKYSIFLPAFTQTITGKSTSSLTPLKEYFSHPQLNEIYKETTKKFEDLSQHETSLQTATNTISRELGISKTPTFVVHVSGFKENVIYVNNTISLSLDKYMGKDWPLYKKYFSPIQTEQMKSQYITRDFIKAWLMADFIKTETTNGNLLSEIIEQGKLLYSLSIALPDWEEKDLLGFNDQQYNLCLTNQKSIWNSLIKNNLYSTDKQKINYLFEYQGINPSIKAPYNIGSWIGLQIVSKYASETHSLLKDILNTDEKTILRKSKYNPNK